MEVADQWRREWAGTAEFGKVVEGGVTRQIARAMEVLNASGPGARVRVMRAAYHSSAGPGLPASSYMVHSSRRVLSSGFNFMDTPSFPTKPLEISSMPFELSQDSNTDTENYKVTEPDDSEISEPSKWRSSLSGNSLRMPSEESSSTDNASIIDLDPRPHKSFFRKQSYDSENSDIPLSGRTSRTSPLLDSPVSLSTLKFKSLLNGNNDWNNRRKSYSFEDTSPLTETIMHSNDTLAMESSTDSGICKSTEIVNENTDDYNNITSKYYKDTPKESDTFQNWLSNNKQNNFYKGTKYKKTMEHNIVVEEPAESNITLQSAGKVSITLPIAIETEDGGYVYRNKDIEENNRRVKKVEFCKTELHFAAETGKVNIISTDDKPPPSTDFRKRRSAFVPLRDMYEKPITLFGEKNHEYSNIGEEFLNEKINEYNDSDENTAATKSILKNKIPKPKPYLLGENMAFGSRDDENYNDLSDAINVPTAVSLINKQIQPNCISPIKPMRSNVTSISQNTFRTINEGPNEISSRHDVYGYRRERSQKTVREYDEDNTVTAMKNIQPINSSPTPARLKTRELRESDLTYFGVNSLKSSADNNKKPSQTRQINVDHDSFQSVKLIKQVSNSVCNSESEDTPEYLNIPFNKKYAPIPTPRQRTRFEDKPNKTEEIKVLKPVIEQEKETKYDDMTISRRSKLRTQEQYIPLKNRSRSEPRKSYQIDSLEKPSRRVDKPSRSTENNIKTNATSSKTTKTIVSKVKAASDDETPIYENVDDLIGNKRTGNGIEDISFVHPRSIKNNKQISENKTDSSKSISKDKIKPCQDTSSRSKVDEIKYTTLEMNNHNIKNVNKTEKSDLNKTKVRRENSSDSSKLTNKSLEHRKRNQSLDKKEHRNRSHRVGNGMISEEKAVEAGTLQCRKEFSDIKTNNESEKTDLKYRKDPIVHHKESSNNDSLKMIPKVVPVPTKNKSMGNKDYTRPSSRSKRSEYVINYDDKNGTVSSVTKIRSNSGSPRRKPARELTREKYKDSLNKKSSDKVALLEPEDHQRNAGSASGNTKWKSKVHGHRSCQVL